MRIPGKIGMLTGMTILGIAASWWIYRAEGNRTADISTGDTADPPTLDAPARRIAVLSTAAEEILFEMGAKDLIVGSSGYSIYTRNDTSIPKIGGPMDVSLERLTQLAPDLIVAQSSDTTLQQFAKTRRIPFYHIDIERIADVPALARTLGDLTGLSNRGEAVATRIEREIESARVATAGRPKIPCFISIDRSPGQMTQLLTTGSSTFLTELVEIAGCRNVFGDLKTRYPVISKESLAARAPEVILELKPDPSSSPDLIARLTADWRLLPRVPAVANHRISVITHDAALTPGPRIAETARIISRALHPGVDAGTTAPDDR